MSYVEVQAALPRNAEQDALAYVPAKSRFCWASICQADDVERLFKFDTLDTPARRPEQLIEFSCSAGISTRSESFDAIVGKVTEAFGEPVEVSRSQDQFQQAGWRVYWRITFDPEYSKMPGAAADTVNIEFVIKKNRRRGLPIRKLSLRRILESSVHQNPCSPPD